MWAEVERGEYCQKGGKWWASLTRRTGPSEMVSALQLCTARRLAPDAEESGVFTAAAQ